MNAALAAGNGRELSNPPSDGISNLRFSNHSDHLLVSSWDRSVRLYDASANVLKGEFMHGGPVLDCCFHDDSSGFSACGDHTVRRYVFSSGKEDILGKHDGPVRCVEYSYAAGQVITGSWDKTLKCWDPRGASGPERTLVGTYHQPERVYSLSLVGHRLVVATAGRHVNVYDLRNMSQPEQRRESSLKYQTRCVRCYPNGTGYALSSVEGRVAMEFFDMSEVGQAKKLVGGLIYLDATTLEGNKYCITGTTKGFYVNSSTGAILNPKPLKSAFEATTLVGLLQKISTKFQKGFREIMEKRASAHPFENVQSLLQPNSWLGVYLIPDHKRDAARAEDAFTHSDGSESIGMQRDWNEELQSCREFSHTTLQERIMRDRALYKVTCDFVDATVNGAIYSS